MASTCKTDAARKRLGRRTRDEIIIDALLSHRGTSVPFDVLQQARAFMAWLITNKAPLKVAEDTVRAAYLQKVVEAAEGNICKAARMAGVHRNTMSRLLGREG